MFYEPGTKPSTKDKFISWLRLQPDQSYDWHNPLNCAVGRFSRSGHRFTSYDEHRELQQLALQAPWTYKALIQRCQHS